LTDAEATARAFAEVVAQFALQGRTRRLHRGLRHEQGRRVAVEVGKHGIRVNCIAPGVIRTSRLVAQSKVTGFVASDDELATILLQRQGSPSDIADVVELPVSFLTGQLIAVNGDASII